MRSMSQPPTTAPDRKAADPVKRPDAALRMLTTSAGPIVDPNPPKAHLPGKGASCPPHGEGGCPFEPGRVRGTHSSAGGVGLPDLHPLMPLVARGSAEERA